MRGTYPNLDPLHSLLLNKMKKDKSNSEGSSGSTDIKLDTEIKFDKSKEFTLPEGLKNEVFSPEGKDQSELPPNQAQRMTYKFMSYISSYFLQPHFHSSFKNLFKILFLSDKIIQHSLALTFRKLHRGKVTSILFAVSNLLTMFTSCIKQS